MFGLWGRRKTVLIGIDFSNLFPFYEIRKRFLLFSFSPTIPNFTRCYINMSARLQKIKATNRFSVRGVLDCIFFFLSSPLAQNKLQRILQERNRFRLSRRSHVDAAHVHKLSNWRFDSSFFVMFSPLTFLPLLEIIVAFRLHRQCIDLYAFLFVTYFVNIFIFIFT